MSDVAHAPWEGSPCGDGIRIPIPLLAGFCQGLSLFHGLRLGVLPPPRSPGSESHPDPDEMCRSICLPSGQATSSLRIP